MIEKFLKRPWQAVALVAFVQAAVLASMVWDRVSLLRGGKEIVLDVVPVDPRSLFRGDYVILGYEVSTIDAALVRGRLERNDVLYVTIEKDAEGKWKPVAASRSRPAEAGPNRLVLEGRSETDLEVGAAHPAQVRVRYGIESYFVPEGTGRALEVQVRDRRIAALIAVDRRGRTAIKGLTVDGNTIYEEAPF